MPAAKQEIANPRSPLHRFLSAFNTWQGFVAATSTGAAWRIFLEITFSSKEGLIWWN